MEAADPGGGRLEGFVALGFNPLLAGPDVPRLFEAMANLKWKVVIDPFMLDSAEFWKAPGQTPAEIDTEVLYLPPVRGQTNGDQMRV